MVRSDRVSVFIIVGFGLAVVLASIVSVVLVFTGDAERPPQYEQSAAPALLLPASEQVIDMANINRPPISDQTFLILHRTTRLVGERFTTARWRATLRASGASSEVIQRVESDLIEIRKEVLELRSRNEKRDEVSVNRPIDNKTRTAVTMTYRGTDDSGSAINPIRVTLVLFWELRSERWTIFEIQPSYAGGESATSDVASDGTGITETEEQEDVTTESDHDVTEATQDMIDEVVESGG